MGGSVINRETLSGLDGRFSVNLDKSSFFWGENWIYLEIW